MIGVIHVEVSEKFGNGGTLNIMLDCEDLTDVPHQQVSVLSVE